MAQHQETKLTVHGNMSGSAVVIGNSNVQTFQAAPDLPPDRTQQLALLEQWLAQLTQEVAKLQVAVGDQRETQTLDRDLKMLTEELETEKPRRRFWEVSVEGLQKAAQAVGTIGTPILKATAQLVPLLKALFP